MAADDGADLQAMVIEAPLGEGGMCLVHRVRLSDGRPAALKVLRPELAADPVQRSRFEREAALAGGLRHPNVVTVLGATTWEGSPGILLEYVDGGSLRQRLGRRLARNEALRILAAVGRGLARAHASGLVHRDLKPENVLLGRDGSVKVADWGLSRPVEDPSCLTKTGVLLGTPAYMAPEQARGEPPTTAVDCWALGIMAWELLSGTSPGSDRSVAETIRACAAGEAPDPAAIRPPLTPDLVTLLRRLMASEPAVRPSSAEAAAVLEREVVAAVACEAEGASRRTRTRALRRQAAPVPAATLRPVPGRRRRVLVCGLAGLTIVVGLVVMRWVFTVPSRAPATSGRVVAVSFHEPDRLRLTIEGPAMGLCRLSIHEPVSGEPLGDGAVTVDLAAATPTVPGRAALVVGSPAVVLAPTVIRVEGAEGERREFPADPGASLERMMEPLEGLGEERTESLLVRLTRIRAELNRVYGMAKDGNAVVSYPAAEIAARGEAASALNEAFGAEALDRFTRVLPRLGRAVVGMDTPWARRLLPLRHLECSLSEWRGARPPWGSLEEALGVSFESFDPRRFKLPASEIPVDPGWQVAGVWELLDARSGKLAWPWLVSPAVLAGYRNSLLMASMLDPSAVVRRVLEVRRDPFVDEIELPTVEGIRSDLRGTLDLSLPPGDVVGAARLEFFFRLFMREHALDVELGEPPRRLTVLNLALGGPSREGFSTVLPVLVSVPIDPRRLRPGAVRIRLAALDVPGQLHAQYPFFVHMVRVLVKQ